MICHIPACQTVGGSGSEKPQSALPFVWFFLCYIWGGGIAMQCPVTCPKHRKQSERYMKWRLKLSKNILTKKNN
jgi:hypothetical protein